MLTVRIEQLTVRGLSPRQIRSLVGCSLNMKRTVKRLKSAKAAIDDLKPLLSLDLPLPEATRRFQAAYIKKQIARARGNMTDAAERLGLHRANLYRKMQQLGMTASE